MLLVPSTTVLVPNEITVLVSIIINWFPFKCNSSHYRNVLVLTTPRSPLLHTKIFWKLRSLYIENVGQLSALSALAPRPEVREFDSSRRLQLGQKIWYWGQSIPYSRPWPLIFGVGHQWPWDPRRTASVTSEVQTWQTDLWESLYWMGMTESCRIERWEQSDTVHLLSDK